MLTKSLFIWYIFRIISLKFLKTYYITKALDEEGYIQEKILTLERPLTGFSGTRSNQYLDWHAHFQGPKNPQF